MKNYLGILAIVIGFVGYVPYFRNMLVGKTKPHAFTWLVWGIITSIAFAAQVSGHGGAGAWPTAFTACACFTIFGFALAKGKRSFSVTDWLYLAGCALALTLWIFVNDPLLAVVLVTLIYILAFIPTFRKSYSQPLTEPAFTFTMSVLKYSTAIIALEQRTLVTALYPASLVIVNGLFVLLILLRRKS